jgi:hypothetical protein
MRYLLAALALLLAALAPWALIIAAAGDPAGRLVLAALALAVALTLAGPPIVVRARRACCTPR